MSSRMFCGHGNGMERNRTELVVVAGWGELPQEPASFQRNRGWRHAGRDDLSRAISLSLWNQAIRARVRLRKEYGLDVNMIRLCSWNGFFFVSISLISFQCYSKRFDHCSMTIDWILNLETIDFFNCAWLFFFFLGWCEKLREVNLGNNYSFAIKIIKCSDMRRGLEYKFNFFLRRINNRNSNESLNRDLIYMEKS